MAEKSAKPKRRIKKAPTVRDQAAKQPVKDSSKQSRTRRVASKVFHPVRALHRKGQKEYYLPMPDNKPGRFLNKRRYIIPSYFRNSFKELREVTWPNRKQTTQLTVAVFIFALIFGVMITITDYGLDKLFKRIFIK